MTGPTVHPPWCDPAHCEAPLGNGCSSTPIVIARDRQSVARLQLRLWRHPAGLPWIADRPLWIEIVTGEHGAGVRHRVDLSPAQLVEMRAAVDALEKLVAGDDTARATG